MLTGLIVLPWWGYVLVTLGLTHITIAAVTIYLHRHQAHRAIELHPLVAHFFRLWLWLTTGMGTREWTAVHRKHHARVETAEDPHSPKIHGIRKVLWEGTELYRREAQNLATLEKYGHGTPDDWLERRVYGFADKTAGLSVMLLLNIALFGPIGLSIWAVQMLWIPLFAAGVINGVGHWRGYRNFETPDAATNIVPIGILIGGEELHNNHHAFAGSARFSVKRWEFDIGWAYIRALTRLGLARVKKLAPRLRFDRDKVGADLDTLSAVVASHVWVMSNYARQVVNRVYREELRNSAHDVRKEIKPTRRLIVKTERFLDEQQRTALAKALRHSRRLEQVYQFKTRLQAIFAQRNASEEKLLAQLQEWCHQAEQTRIKALQDFSRSLTGYTLESA